ncbi:MAG: ATP-binding protein [Candidatus Freyarchaeota archaeon]
MYPFDVAEVVIMEIVANSLDAGASSISINFDSNNRILTITDNGKGMSASEFEQYHDFAAGLKTRGTGIGFAGVGAKIAFNVASRVVTETRSESFTGGSNWYMQSKRKLVWEDFTPQNLKGRGTRVEVHFMPDVSLPYSSTEDLVTLLKRHYLPLFYIRFLELYERLHFYSGSLRFTVNGQIIEPGEFEKDFNLTSVREFYPKRAAKRIGYGVLGLTASEYPLGPDRCGVLLCTRGKVIKADLFNQFPGDLGPRILGVVEVPSLLKFLTTSKTDFIRGQKYREFEGYYNPVRQEFKAWLEELGVRTEIETDEVAKEAAKLERELKKILDEVPELSDFFGFRTKKPVLQENSSAQVSASVHEGAEVTFPAGGGGDKGELAPTDIGNGEGQALVEDEEGTQHASPISRMSRRGPKVGFSEIPDRVELAWVDGNNIVINSGHPSYKKVKSDVKARTLHNLFAIATAVQKLRTEEKANVLHFNFIDRMMAAWGRK